MRQRQAFRTRKENTPERGSQEPGLALKVNTPLRRSSLKLAGYPVALASEGDQHNNTGPVAPAISGPEVPLSPERCRG